MKITRCSEICKISSLNSHYIWISQYFHCRGCISSPTDLGMRPIFSASSKWELFSWSKYTRHFHPWLYWFPPQREQHKTIQFYRLAHLLSPSALCGCDSVHILLLHRIYWLCPLSKTSEDAIPLRMHHCKSLRKGALDFSIRFLKVHSCLHFSMDTAQTSKQPSKSACSDILHWPYSTPFHECASQSVSWLFFGQAIPQYSSGPSLSSQYNFIKPPIKKVFHLLISAQYLLNDSSVLP